MEKLRKLNRTVLLNTYYLYLPDLVTFQDNETIEYLVSQEVESVTPGWQWLITPTDISLSQVGSIIPKNNGPTILTKGQVGSIVPKDNGPTILTKGQVGSIVPKDNTSKSENKTVTSGETKLVTDPEKGITTDVSVSSMSADLFLGGGLSYNLWQEMFTALTKASRKVKKSDTVVDAAAMFTSCITYEFSTRMQTAVNRFKWLIPDLQDTELMIFYRLAENLDNGYAMQAIDSVMYQQGSSNIPIWVIPQVTNCGTPATREESNDICSLDADIQEFKLKQQVAKEYLNDDPPTDPPASQLDDLEWKLLENRVLGVNLEDLGNKRLAEIKDVSLTDALETISFMMKREINIYTEKDTDVTLVSQRSSEQVIREIPEDKKASFELLALAQDEVLFHLMGPSNPFEDLEPNPDYELDECVLFGGCRMLLCKHCSDEDDSDAPRRYSPDWFTGECESCANIITRRSHALRIPLIGGAWYGCYCSNLNCIIGAIYNKFRELNIRNAHYRLLAGMLDQLIVIKVWNN